MGSTPSTQRAVRKTTVMTMRELSMEMFANSDHHQHSEAYILKPNLADKLKLVDASTGGDQAHKSFYECSIPTARFLDVTNKLKEPNTKYPNTFPSSSVVENTLGDLGLSEKDKVVLYYQPGTISGACRAFFVLHAYGFHHLKVLDGGLSKYVDQHYPTVKGEDFKQSAKPTLSLADPDRYLANFDEISKFAKGDIAGVQLIDVRSEDEFHGATLDFYIEGCKGGHIKGSHNIPKSKFIHDDGETFMTKYELLNLTEEHGLDPDKKTICMCYSGLAASVAYTALKKAGFNHLQVYDGSWAEYGSRM